MRSSPLGLLLLIGIQAVLNMGGGGALSPGAANHRAGQQTAANHRAAGQQQQQQQQQTAVAGGDRLSERHDRRAGQQRSRKPQRGGGAPPPASPAQEQSSVAGLRPARRDPPLSDSSIPEVDPKLFSKRRYRSSPRVAFGETAPSHDALETGAEEVGGGGGRGNGRGSRVRRRVGEPMNRGEYSVCDSINVWVGNLTQATDMAGNEVTVLPNFKIDNEVKKQFFFETTCRAASVPSGPPGKGGGGGGRGGGGGGRGGGGGGGSKSGCRGIDSRHWNSYCTNTHTYVRALTTFRNRTAWRHIRINAACVCVLSRKSWRNP